MNKKLLLLPALSISLIAAAHSEERSEQPNILMIAVDDLNDWIGALGNYPGVCTPNIDRLAKSGMLFTNAHCAAPLSGPSRAATFSGLYPSTSGNYFQITDQQIMLSNDVTAQITFFPDYMERHGYKTMGVGKLFHNGDRLGVFEQYDTMFHDFGFGPYQPNRERLEYCPSWFGLKGTSTDWGVIDIEDEEMHDHKAATWTIERLEEQHDSPFLLAVGFVRPHVPWYVPKKWSDMFPIEDIVTPPYLPTDLDDVPDISVKLHEVPPMPKTEWLIKENKWASMVQGYIASMAFMDAQVGRVLDALESSDYADNTIIVLWSDHGYHLGEKGRTCKHSLWERATRVPLIFAGDFIKKQQRCDAPVTLVDLYPTLLDLCGMPANNLNDGHSIKPLLGNPKSRWKNAAVTSYGKGHTSVYYGGYHYIEYSNGESELYGLKRDPNEWNNIANEKKYQNIRRELKSFLPETFANYSPYTKLGINSFIDTEVRANWGNNKIKK